jgi:hypothetical protein
MTITLDEINNTLLEQNKSLDITAKSIVKFIEGEKSDRGDELEAKLDASREKKRAVTRPQGFKAGFKQGLGDATGLGTVARWVSAALAGAFSGATLATLAGFVGKYLARSAVWGTAALLVGQFGAKLLEKVFTDLDPNDVFLDKDTKAAIVPYVVDAFKIGFLAMIGGRKLALAAFFGSLIGSAITKSLKLSPGEKDNQFGFEMPWTKEDFIKWGSTIALFFAPSMILGAIRRGIGMGSTGGPAGGAGASSAAKRGFLRGFIPRAGIFKGLGWAGLLNFTGGLLADWVGEQTGNQKAADFLNMSVSGLTMLAIFGPTPVGIGFALAAFFIHGFILVKNRIDREKARLDAEFEAQVIAQQSKIADMKGAEQVGFFNKTIKDAAQESVYGGTHKYGAQSVNEEAILRHLEQTNPAAAKKLLLEYDIQEANLEYKRLESMTGSGIGSNVALNAAKSELMRLLEEMKVLQGKPHRLETEMMMGNGNGSAFPGRGYSTGQTTGDFLDLSYLPMTARSRRRIDYSALLPPKAATTTGDTIDTLMNTIKYGSGGNHPNAVAVGQLGDTNTTYNSGSVVYQGSTPTQDIYRGGSSGFSIIGQIPLLS